MAISAEPSPIYNVPGMVKALLAWRGIPTHELRSALHLSQASLSDRLTGKRQFRDAEIQQMAGFFHVNPGVFYTDLDSLLRTTVTLRKHGRPDLELVSSGSPKRRTEDYRQPPLLRPVR